MKPRTKYDKNVVAIQSTLPRITEEQKQYALDKSFENYYVVSRNRYICLECNHKWTPQGPSWHDQVVGQICPSCSKKLKLISYKATTYDIREYFSIVTVFKGFQLIRHFYMSKFLKKKEKPRYHMMEVCQQFIDVDGRTTTFACLSTYGYHSNVWVFGSEIELRATRQYYADRRYNINPTAIWPKIKVLPIFKRNGFKSSFHDIAPHGLLIKLLYDPITETLIKTRQYGLLREHDRSPNRVNRYWNSVKICMRNGYKISDAGLWLDYLETLEWFNKDVRSPIYVCPPNLREAHNKLMVRKEAVRRAEREKREKEDAELQARLLKESRERYATAKGHFFGLVISDGPITITPLESVQEFEDEGKELFHCVFINKYYNKPNSLCLSAKVDGVRKETIEVTLDTFEIVQSRGYDNKPSEYNSRIVDVMKQNMKLIRKRHLEHKKQLKAKKTLQI